MEPLSSGQLVLDRPNFEIKLTGGTVLGWIWGVSVESEGRANSTINGRNIVMKIKDSGSYPRILL